MKQTEQPLQIIINITPEGLAAKAAMFKAELAQKEKANSAYGRKVGHGSISAKTRKRMIEAQRRRREREAAQSERTRGKNGQFVKA